MFRLKGLYWVIQFECICMVRSVTYYIITFLHVVYSRLLLASSHTVQPGKIQYRHLLLCNLVVCLKKGHILYSINEHIGKKSPLYLTTSSTIQEDFKASCCPLCGPYTHFPSESPRRLNWSPRRHRDESISSLGSSRGHPEVARWFPFNNSKLFILIRGVTVVPERERVSIGRTRPWVCQESSGPICKTDRNTKSPINTNDTPGINLKYLARFIIGCIHCFPQIKTTCFMVIWFQHQMWRWSLNALRGQEVAGSVQGPHPASAPVGQHKNAQTYAATTFCLHSTLRPLVLHSKHPKHQQ